MFRLAFPIMFLMFSAFPSFGTSADLSPEERQLLEMLQQKLLNSVQHANASMHHEKEPEASARLSEAQLLQLISDARSEKAAVPLRITLSRDGTANINGTIFSDYEGKIAQISTSSSNGDVVYLVPTSETAYTVKWAQPLGEHDPIVVGTLERFRNQVRFSSMTGKKINADAVLLGSDGLLFLRYSGHIIGQKSEPEVSEIFIYEFGKKIISVRSPDPDKYEIISHQDGDVFGSRLVALYNQKASGGLFIESHYAAMMNIDTGKIVVDMLPFSPEPGGVAFPFSGRVVWKTTRDGTFIASNNIMDIYVARAKDGKIIKANKEKSLYGYSYIDLRPAENDRLDLFAIGFGPETIKNVAGLFEK